MMKFRNPETPSYGLLRQLRIVIDPWIAIPALLILSASLIALFSVVYHPIAFEINPGLAKDISTPFTKHLLWGLFGMAGMTFTAFAKTDSLKNNWVWIYLSGIILLLAVLFFGIKVRNIRAWLSIGLLTFQPSELVKAILVISLSAYLAKKERREKRLRSLIVTAVLVGIPAVLVLKQPDMGTVIVYLSLLLTLPFIAGLPARYMVLIVISGMLSGLRLLLGIAAEHPEIVQQGSMPTVIVDPSLSYKTFAVLGIIGAVVALTMRLLRMKNAFCVFLYFVLPIAAVSSSFILTEHLKDYQKTRLLSFIAPQLDPKGSGYNIIQSRIAFGSGGVLGKGIRGATQSSLGFLPERQTDFIFSVIGEVFGFAGTVIVISAFLILCLRILWIAANARDRFGSILAAGVFTIMLTHIIINMGMAVGIMPIMGIPLPLASYGGTAMVSIFIMLGLVLAVERESRLV